LRKLNLAIANINSDRRSDKQATRENHEIIKHEPLNIKNYGY